MTSYVLWVFVSLIAYIAGIIVLVRTTPMLLRRQYDEGLFMGIAAIDIIGALLAFGAVVITFAIFSGGIGVRILDVLLLFGIFFASAFLVRRSLRPYAAYKTFRASRIIAGSYSACLALASLYYIVQMFIAR